MNIFTLPQSAGGVLLTVLAIVLAAACGVLISFSPH